MVASTSTATRSSVGWATPRHLKSRSIAPHLTAPHAQQQFTHDAARSAGVDRTVVASCWQGISDECSRSTVYGQRTARDRRARPPRTFSGANEALAFETMQQRMHCVRGSRPVHLSRLPRRRPTPPASTRREPRHRQRPRPTTLPRTRSTTRHDASRHGADEIEYSTVTTLGCKRDRSVRFVCLQRRECVWGGTLPQPTPTRFASS